MLQIAITANTIIANVDRVTGKQAVCEVDEYFSSDLFLSVWRIDGDRPIHLPPIKKR